MQGRAYALELLDLIENPLKSKKLHEYTFSYIATEIARRSKALDPGVYYGFFDTISEQLITGRVRGRETVGFSPEAC